MGLIDHFQGAGDLRAFGQPDADFAAGCAGSAAGCRPPWSRSSGRSFPTPWTFDVRFGLLRDVEEEALVHSITTVGGAGSCTAGTPQAVEAGEQDPLAVDAVTGPRDFFADAVRLLCQGTV